MLVLSRKKGETIIIDDKIEIKVLDVAGDKVQLGISAPKEIGVVRSELNETIEENKNSTASVSKDKLASFFNARKDR